MTFKNWLAHSTKNASDAKSVFRTFPPQKTSGLEWRLCNFSLSAGLVMLASILTFAASPVSARSAPTGQSAALEGGETTSGNYLAAIVAGNKQDISPAAKFYIEALKTDPRNKELIERAFLSVLADGNMPEAFRLADRLLARDQNAALANLASAVRNIKTKQFATARKFLARSGGKYRNSDPTVGFLTAWTYAGSGEHAKALETTDRFSQPGMSELRNYQTGLMADIAGNKAEALKRLGAAYEADKGNLPLADTYARAQARLGDKAIAQKIYEDIIALAPNELQIKIPLQELKDGKIPEPKVKSSLEGAAQVFYVLGNSRVRPGEEILPLIYMQFAHYLAPDDELVPFALAEGFASLNQHERAISYFDAIEEDSPLHLRANIRKAFSLESIERTDDAINTLNKLVATNEADLDVLNSLGVMLRVKKRWPEAIQAYTTAIEKSGPPAALYWSLYHGRGMCLERNKEWPKAEADLKIALNLLPDDPKLGPLNAYNRAQVLNYLGYSWVDQGVHIDEAFPMLKRAVELTDARDGYIIDSLGWAYYRQAQFDDAVRELEKASSLKSGDPVINDHLGDAYWKVGRKLEAQFQWNHARDLKPEPDDLVRILKKIENGMEENQPAAAAVVPAKPNGG